jgi:Coiled-coil domain containing protein (DUF2052)
VCAISMASYRLPGRSFPCLAHITGNHCSAQMCGRHTCVTCVAELPQDCSCPCDHVVERASAVQVAAFERLMRERFLSGGDSAFIDYEAIDNDPSLDEFWAREEMLDAQERYFDDIS